MSGRLFRTELVETDDTGDLQTTRLLGLPGEELTNVHRVGHFGFHSVAPPGSHGIGIQFLRGGRTLTAALGLEHASYRPRGRELGSTAIYDMHGNIVSLVQSSMRFVHATEIRLVSPSIVLDGIVKLGGDDAAMPAAMRGTIDSAGHTDVGGLATKVFVK